MAEHGQALAPADKARFLILLTPETVERKKRILGSVVPYTNIYMPYDNYVPYLKDPDLTPGDLQSLEDLSDFLWQEEANSTVPLTNNVFGRTSGVDTSAQAQVTELLRGSIGRVNRQDVQITAGAAKRYTMDNKGRALETHLVRNTSWMAQLNKLNQDLGVNCPLCLVTGVYTCTDLEVRWSLDRDRQAGLNVGLPLGQVMGAAKFNLDLRVDHHNTDGSQVVAHCAQELVFALAYNELILVPEEARQPEPKRFGWLRPNKNTLPLTKPQIIRAVLGLPIIGHGINNYAGEEDKNEKEKGGESIFCFEEADTIFIPRPEWAGEVHPGFDNGNV